MRVISTNYMSLNQKYLASLAKYPLLTKSATAGVFAALNEVIATSVSGEFQRSTVRIAGKTYTIKHALSPKIVLMVVYGALLATPISHLLYAVLSRVFKGKVLPKWRVLQILASLSTITPTLSAVYVAWLALVNGYRPKTSDVGKELARVWTVVKSALRNNFWLVYRMSATTSVVAITVAQKLLPPELWVVFFTFVYFVVGTVQNTRFKLKQKRKQE